MLINGGIQPDYLSPAQLDKFNSQPPHVQQKSIATYNDHMAQQHRQTMSQGGMLNQGSPMMHGAMDVGAAGINDFYNAGPQAMRIAQQNANGTAGNHALQDYQMQLMLLEQQNKKRLMMARQEQNNLHPDGQPMAGQGFPTGMSPQGSRSGPSPNPSDQMKRGTPKMGPAGLPMSGSPMPEGAMPPGRGSPGPMNLNGGQIPPEMFQQAMKGMGEGMAVGPNGVMRPPPSSHPQFANGLTQQQVEAMRAQAAQNGGRMPNGVNWPQGPQGQAPMIPQPSQPQQAVGTPQQRTAMPPPQGLPAAGAANGRPSPPSQAANPPTPQQSTKANPKPKKDAKDRKVIGCISSYFPLVSLTHDISGRRRKAQSLQQPRPHPKLKIPLRLQPRRHPLRPCIPTASKKQRTTPTARCKARTARPQHPRQYPQRSRSPNQKPTSSSNSTPT